MSTRMTMKFDGIGESSVDHEREIDYEHQHRDAVHEHERKPEPSFTLRIACAVLLVEDQSFVLPGQRQVYS